jgi:dTMP kinase
VFIVFEGGDGSGKSTHARALFRRLLREGYTAILTREPGGTFIGETVRRLLKKGPDLDPVAELFLFSAARGQLVAEVISPALRKGIIVVCDRFTASTVAYQGYGRGLSLSLVTQLNHVASDGLVPDITVLLDLPIEAGLARKGNTTTDNFENEPLEFHRRVRNGYLDQMAQRPASWLVVDASQSPHIVARKIWASIQPFL